MCPQPLSQAGFKKRGLLSCQRVMTQEDKDEIINKLREQLAAKKQEIAAIDEKLRRYEYEVLLAERAAFASCRVCALPYI